ncbi:MAG TPA: hypothetical protein DCF63_07305, partial [Planctomycetaceae bacterium]|nr:hypothetical protein [Planctomycetaceae bacterium]
VLQTPVNMIVQNKTDGLTVISGVPLLNNRIFRSVIFRAQNVSSWDEQLVARNLNRNQRLSI